MVLSMVLIVVLSMVLIVVLSMIPILTIAMTSILTIAMTTPTPTPHTIESSSKQTTSCDKKKWHPTSYTKSTFTSPTTLDSTHPHRLTHSHQPSSLQRHPIQRQQCRHRLSRGIPLLPSTQKGSPILPRIIYRPINNQTLLSQSQPFHLFKHNFISSIAAYSIISFVLQLKDRNDGNVHSPSQSQSRYSSIN